ncbi:SRPBCC family protein [Ruegeria sediminis]|uniref:SRPBCC family protein n=1 Tax=Ruegeria sediminis TaxID=2583820 RepID=A0ABY2WVL1_9RHOB|nr:SRPBCC family protein [Ruegeria sediminis]TMV06789.1 SRPBCC family protein [Ruegeria sediminis]
MQLSGKQDIEVPIDAVFGMLSEYDRFERFAIRRGVEVRRTGPVAPVSEGLIWDTVFVVRGKPRPVQVVLRQFEPPHMMRFEATGKGVNGETIVELLALSPRRTRLIVEMSLSARTLPARLLLQSLKLGKARLRRQFHNKLEKFSGTLEARYAGLV